MIATATYQTFNPYDVNASCMFKISGGTTIGFQATILSAVNITEAFVINIYRSYDGIQWVATATGTSNITFSSSDVTKVSDEYDARAVFWKLATKPGSSKTTSNNNVQITAMVHSNTETPQIVCLTTPISAA